VQNRFFLFQFGFGLIFEKKKTWIWSGMSLVLFGLDIIVTYYLCNS